MVRKKTAKLPALGDAFAFPLADGRFSVCRVLLDATSAVAKKWGNPVVAVAVSAWIGSEIPGVDDPVLRPILHLNHHAWSDEPATIWVSEEPPSHFIYLGKIKPTAKEQALCRLSFGRWESLTIQPLTQWRWDHERGVVLAEDAIQEKAEAERQLVAQQQRDEYLSRVTLEQLRTRRFFRRWRIPPAKAVRASRELMTRTVERLIELGPNASEVARMAALQECIEAFNSLDAKMKFIETDEREDICVEFEAVVHACGLGAHQQLADRWREW
jgi:hypothetical protein